MIKKFWSYQFILSGSLRLGKTYDDSSHAILKLFLVLFLTPIVIFNEVNEMSIVIMLTYSLLFLYYIINSPKRLYDVLPVSKLYHIINIYLYPVLVSILILITFQSSLLIFKSIIYFFTKLDFIKIDLLVTFGNMKLVIVFALSFIIITCIFIPSFFVKPLAIRRTYIVLEIILVKIALSLFNKSIAYNSGISFSDKISLITNYNGMLMILIACCVVIVPLSIILSYRIYRGKGRKLC